MVDTTEAMAALQRLTALLGRRHDDWRAFKIPSDRALLVSFINPHAVRMTIDRPGYVADLAEMDVLLPDGNLLASSASRQLGRVIVRESFDGNSMAPEVFAFCRTHALKIALVGGVHGVAERAAGVFATEFDAEVVYARSGFFTGEGEVQACYDRLRALNVDVVICGMGAPHQERFLLGLKDSGWKGLGFTCGGYLDQALDGGVKYYPEWVNRLNLRAPYRLCREPGRLWRRYLVEYLPFVVADLRLRLARGPALPGAEP
ncbi:WecB/TagA/CpsF family glycosyltransferase [Stenotrophomonas sp. SAM-B]|uniref:WecB/TagA/CpsF family glycosyltransferase n=1 Tax=Stenotrophomonas sp. SAM-B TaxID=2729141 RepID=UPI0015A458EE|nr:WecB/TagA/CpsF family glycosyltransferase [Stenotrophomonas sp. SAM-B]NWF33730.1 WecB/TagA/CpsF family glycosyltransferase [Stenotrophomonas sp. SAM-B]